MKAYFFHPWFHTDLRGGSPAFSGSALLLKESWSLNLDAASVADLGPVAHECLVTGYQRVYKDAVSMSRSVSRTANDMTQNTSQTWTFPVMTATGKDAPRYAVFFYGKKEQDGSATVWSDETRQPYCVWDFEAPQDVVNDSLVLDPDSFLRFVVDPAAVTA